MPKKTTAEIEQLFKSSFKEVKGTRSSGWRPEDSEPIVFTLLGVQTDRTGKEVKIPPATMEKLKAAMLITPQRILPFIFAEMESLGVAVDETTKRLLARLIDVTGFRQELVEGNVLAKSPKGKTKQSITDLLK